jgi:hypothetical protein
LATSEAAKDARSSAAFQFYFVVEGAAGAGAVGDAGAAGRVVDPVVVPGAVLSATRGPLQGAHMNKSAKMKKAAIAAIAVVLMPLPRRSISSRIVFSSTGCPSEQTARGWIVPFGSEARHARMLAAQMRTERPARKGALGRTASVRRAPEAVIPVASDLGGTKPEAVNSTLDNANGSCFPRARDFSLPGP